MKQKKLKSLSAVADETKKTNNTPKKGAFLTYVTFYVNYMGYVCSRRIITN